MTAYTHAGSIFRTTAGQHPKKALWDFAGLKMVCGMGAPFFTSRPVIVLDTMIVVPFPVLSPQFLPYKRQNI